MVFAGLCSKLNSAQPTAPCCRCRTHAAAIPLLLRLSSFIHTGVIPAVDTGSDIPAAAELGDLAAARAITAALAKAGVVNLDAWLSPAQKAEQLAFITLVTSKLDVATHYTTWLEARGFREFRKVKPQQLHVWRTAPGSLLELCQCGHGYIYHI